MSQESEHERWQGPRQEAGQESQQEAGQEGQQEAQPKAPEQTPGKLKRAFKFYFDLDTGRLMPVVALLVINGLAFTILFTSGQGQDLLNRDGTYSLILALGAYVLFLFSIASIIATGAMTEAEEVKHPLSKVFIFVSAGAVGLFGVLAGIVTFSSCSWGWVACGSKALGAYVGVAVTAFVSALVFIAPVRGLAEASSVIAAVFCWIIAATVLLMTALMPGQLGQFFGSPILLVVVMAAWVYVFFGLALVGSVGGREGKGPRIAVLILLFLLLAKSVGVGIHETTASRPVLDHIRPKDDSTGAELLTLKSAYETWREAWRKANPDKPNTRPTLVLVAAAGGGIRASFWTSLVLTRLVDQATEFRQALFASSGVSGGSLGLGVFYGLLASSNPKCKSGAELEPCVVTFHQHDFLAGTLAATFAGYPANALLPVFPSRNEALEVSWERAWRNTVGTDTDSPDAFSSPMKDLAASSGAWRPLLLLNATSASTGERALAATVAIESWISNKTKCKLNLVEETAVPLSAAIGVSARFPILSDLGWVKPRPSRGCPEFLGLADGGYYDNYGAATVLDLMGQLKESGVDLQRHVRLIVIQVTSDPDLGIGCIFSKLDQDEKGVAIRDHCQASTRSTAWSRVKRFFFGYPEPGVLDVAMGARSAAGIGTAEQLRELTCNLRGAYYHFAMTGAEDIPLGWTLSDTAQNKLKSLLGRRVTESGAAGADINESRLKRLVALIKHGAGEAKGQCDSRR
jgi:hypothetical protein